MICICICFYSQKILENTVIGDWASQCLRKTGRQSAIVMCMAVARWRDGWAPTPCHVAEIEGGKGIKFINKIKTEILFNKFCISGVQFPIKTNN